MLKTLSKIFGNKSERDVKKLQNTVKLINANAESYKNLSDDELRNKTTEFKTKLAEALCPIKKEIETLNSALNKEDISIEQKFSITEQLTKLKNDSYKASENFLNKILPEAFAVVKETARRFSSNKELRVTATELDHTLAAKKDNVKIEGQFAVYSNTWKVCGYETVWNMVHYDVQLIGGIVLHQGKIAEMATGEGKTLVATCPAYLNALTGLGVHLVTVNDYLAKRDSEWMGPLYEFHGLLVDCIDNHMPNSEARRNAYRADIIFGTNNEFGFDYLRDNMSTHVEELVQSELNYAMVDEVDSVLIDDARTPLIISGPSSIQKDITQNFTNLKPYIQTLVQAQQTYIVQVLKRVKDLIKEDDNSEQAGILLLQAHRGMPKNKTLIKLLSQQGLKQLLQKTENIYLQDQQRRMPEVDKELFFVIEERSNSIELTEKGVELLTSNTGNAISFVLPNIGEQLAELETRTDLSEEEKQEEKEKAIGFFSEQSEKIHLMHQLLKAYCLFEKNVEYIVEENEIKLVDEQTGRIMEGRRYSDGLHQAIEAKENVQIKESTQTLASITLQNYFRIYNKLAGMTGTAVTEASELWEIYKLEVVEIPPNKSLKRIDHHDLVYRSKREKYNAVIDYVAELSNQGRPVLVGTTSVEVSELLSKILSFRKIRHNVLNAKMHKKEAEIITQAGHKHSVTIATNMAGRGTDIKLGSGVKEIGGLAIIGTERHESRRVDRQLRGRAGRQGDPGSSQFFVSLEDNLMRLFGSERIASLMDRMGLKEGEVIQHSMITKSIERAQKKVEENNFGIRKRLLEYDNIMNMQRKIIYKKRRLALTGTSIDLVIDDMIYESCEELAKHYHQEKNLEKLKIKILKLFYYKTDLNEEALEKNTKELGELLYNDLIKEYKHKMSVVRSRLFEITKGIIKDGEVNAQESVIVFPIRGENKLPVKFNIQEAYNTEGQHIISELEKKVLLYSVDEHWKYHLNQMDELKQAVQNAVYEQKDPLLIYKLEAFKIFTNLLSEINSTALSILLGMLSYGNISTEQKYVEESPLKNVRISHQEFKGDPGNNFSNNIKTAKQQIIPDVISQNLAHGAKIRRNDPCPCGSGKKFKQCHGRV